MVLFKLSYFDTGCLKKVKTEEKIWFPHNYKQPELKTLEWDILNPDRIINLEIKNERRTSNI